MSTDKNFCMSSFLAFRYIEDKNKDFFENTKHYNITPINESEKIIVRTSKDIDEAIKSQISLFNGKKIGLLLSGGMDSAILASYISGAKAYTFRFLNGSFQEEELKRAEYYASYYNLDLSYVDINWNTVETYVDACIKEKGAPVHSIEPQILQAAFKAKGDGVEILLIGESSDLVFGGMDKLLSQDWIFDDFVNRYTFLYPNKVLKNPVSMNYLYERYRDNNRIDFLKFMNDIFSIESSSSYMNAFGIANMKYYDPYAKLKMAIPLDLNRIRNGESKYLIRELFKNKYPHIQVPDKVPMPRPVDEYFKNWKGPVRSEFIDNLNMEEFTGNQKWQIWCLERFLNLYDPQ